MCASIRPGLTVHATSAAGSYISATMIANPFGVNTSVAFNCTGALATSQRNDLIILGAPGHRCTLTSNGMTAFGIGCTNLLTNASCSSSCSR